VESFLVRFRHCADIYLFIYYIIVHEVHMYGTVTTSLGLSLTVLRRIGYETFVGAGAPPLGSGWFDPVVYLALCFTVLNFVTLL